MNGVPPLSFMVRSIMNVRKGNVISLYYTYLSIFPNVKLFKYEILLNLLHYQKCAHGENICFLTLKAHKVVGYSYS